MPAPDLSGIIQKCVSDLKKEIYSNIPIAVGIEVSEAFKDNFNSGGFFGQKWQTPLRIPAQLPGPPNGPLLSENNHLRDSTLFRTEGGRVIIYNIVHYAGIHNEGGEITVTKRMKGHFWGRYDEAGGYNHGKPSKEALFWRNMALKKVGSRIKIPKRQFMGEHPQVTKIIDDTIEKRLTNFVNSNFNGINIRRSR